MTRKKYRRALRTRITLSFVLFSALLTSGVAISVNFALEDIEKRMAQEVLRLEMEHFTKRYTDNPATPPPNGAMLRGYLADDNLDKVPAYLRGLGVGTHEVQHDRHFYHVRIDKVGNKTIYLVRDATMFEAREEAVSDALIAVVIGSTLIAFGISAWLSRKVISPVSSLARLVSEHKTEDASVGLAARFPDDEVGELAESFDRFSARLYQFVEREKEFTADASHELRTPLTVINGAVELLLANNELPERSRKVVKRIERASRDMAQVLDALLFLAREPHSAGALGTEKARLSDVARQVIDDHRYLSEDKKLPVRLNVHTDGLTPVTPTIVAIVLGNLLRNALNYTASGSVTVDVDSPTVTIRDTGVGIAAEDLPRVTDRYYRGGDAKSAGSGLGLAIVKRICDRYGWQLRIASQPQQGTTVSVYLDRTHPTEKVS